jgi:hypothetical protein
MILGIFSVEDGQVDTKKWEPYVTYRDGKKSNDESILQKLIFDHPELFPVNQIADNTDQWIPLTRELDTTGGVTGRHGILDILATDDSGNIYIVECKLRYNTGDMKSIRGQISDYTSAFYRHFKNDSDVGWKWFKDSIDNNPSINGTLEDILNNAKVPVDETIESMKKNFKENKIILVFAVDAMTSGLWDAIDWHNNALNPEHNYPCFAIEVRKYGEEENNEKKFVGIQTYPFDLTELIRKESQSRRYFQHTGETFQKQFEKSNLSEQQIQIFNHAKKELEEIADVIEYNTPSSDTATAKLLPKFQNLYECRRAPFTLHSNGHLQLQFDMLSAYENYKGKAKPTKLSEIFGNALSKIPEIKREFDKKPGALSPRLKPEIWMPVYKQIFKSLEEII